MMDKIEMKLGKKQETLLLPLWGRAVESKKDKPRLIDTKAIEIVDSLDYDFSLMSKNISWVSQLAWVARSIHVDRTIRNFIANHPSASIVNIGCGLDTTFERIDTGRIICYDLDLPDVIELRKKYFREGERRKFISCSFFDTSWYHQIDTQGGVLLIAAGVFYYFEEKQIIDFFIRVADGE